MAKLTFYGQGGRTVSQNALHVLNLRTELQLQCYSNLSLREVWPMQLNFQLINYNRASS